MTRFSEAWSQVASQNHVLKLVSLSLALTTAMLGAALMMSALKPPLIIERSCYSKVAQPSADAVSVEELESFLKEVLSFRFDSGAVVQTEYLSIEELKSRDTEQAELSKRGMKQRVLLNSLKRAGDTIEVDADRLISAGSIRSALTFSLSVEVEATQRTAGNPYGLVLIKTRPVRASGDADPRGGQKTGPTSIPGGASGSGGSHEGR